jgi:NAD(P)-dependent dehydrogenase (short-subunit alcohol dehydrogenase family)
MDENDPRARGAMPPYTENTQSSAPGRESLMLSKPDHGESWYVGSGRLNGKIALITGGDSGIGRAVALAFAREGADVAIGYFPSEEEDAHAAAELVTRAGRRVLLVPGDLAEASACATLVQKTVSHFGRIDILVNNAAHQEKAVASIQELTPERLDRTFRVNIIAMFHLVREALPHMRPGGSIINTASIQAYSPSPPILDYAATKGAIVAFTKGLALSAIEQGIRVNAVAPGPVWTPLIAESFEGEKLRMFGAKSPMKRAAQPVELAPAYVFLASAEASYINGEILGVTGGSPLG